MVSVEQKNVEQKKNRWIPFLGRLPQTSPSDVHAMLGSPEALRGEM